MPSKDTSGPIPRTRKDPRRRSIDGSAPWSRLSGEDKERHYVYAATNDNDTGLAYYRMIGYEVEKYGPGRPRPRGMPLEEAKRLEGQPIEIRGATLVSCSRERYEEIQEFGPDGQSGMSVIEERRAAVRRAKHGIPNDDIRGIGEFSSRHFQTQNDSDL